MKRNGASCVFGELSIFKPFFDTDVNMECAKNVCCSSALVTQLFCARFSAVPRSTYYFDIISQLASFPSSRKTFASRSTHCQEFETRGASSQKGLLQEFIHVGARQGDCAAAAYGGAGTCRGNGAAEISARSYPTQNGYCQQCQRE